MYRRKKLWVKNTDCRNVDSISHPFLQILSELDQHILRPRVNRKSRPQSSLYINYRKIKLFEFFWAI